MKIFYITICVLLGTFFCTAQEYDTARIQKIETQLEALAIDIPGLTEKIDISLQQTKLTTFLLAIAEVHKINIDAHPELANTTVINNFKNVEVGDVLVYLCKNQDLTIDITGTILSVKKVVKAPEIIEERVIPVRFNPTTQLLFADIQADTLSEVLKSISTASGKGIFFTQDMGEMPVSAYINEMPFETAMEKIAFSNNLIVTKTKDGSFEFEKIETVTGGNRNGNATKQVRPAHSRRSNFYFKVLDTVHKKLDISFENVPVADVVYDIGNALQLDIFTASSLDNAGTATVTAKNISFDALLTKIFESATLDTQDNTSGRNRTQGANQLNGGSQFTYKIENGVYYFGTSDQLSLRTSEIVPLYYRSIEMLSDPNNTGRSVGRTVSVGETFGNNGLAQTTNPSGAFSTSTSQRSNTSNGGYLLDLIPIDIQGSLSITTDVELNSFIVSGSSEELIKFKEFVKKIDKPVPVVMIEVMILDISRSTTLEAGVEWGIGELPSSTSGTLFPRSQLTLGATTINRILGRIDGSSFFNIGKVVPNFFANIRAMESNGILKVRSSPRITTLNGHRAYFSNGETSYYAVTNQTFNGTQNPITSEITNYQPIDAELSLDVKPFVSVNGEITMDIKVIQSNFNGQRIAEDAPPGINSREFTSIVKARNNDIVVLGGLEERRISNSGTGVPFLARIPIIKWLFSQRIREGSKSKLTVLIKPTVIY